MNKALRIFVKVWIGVAILVNVIAVIAMLVLAESLWAGLNRFCHVYSPFNLWNWVAEVVLLSPAIGAELWLQKRQSRQVGNQPT